MHRFMRALRDGLPGEKVFVFHGPERYIWRRALEYIREHSGKPLLRVDASEAGPREVALRLGKGLWGELPVLWVDHVEAWKEREFSDIARVLEDPPTRVVLTSTRELRLPRDFPAQVVFFPQLSYRSQEQWLRAEIRRRNLSITREAYRLLWSHIRGEPLEKAVRILEVLELYRDTLDVDTLLALLPGLPSRIYALGDALLDGDGSLLSRVLEDHGTDEQVIPALKHTALRDLLALKAGREVRLSWKQKKYALWNAYFTEKDLASLWHHLSAVQVVARNQGRFSLALRHALLAALDRPFQKMVEKTS